MGVITSRSIVASAIMTILVGVILLFVEAGQVILSYYILIVHLYGFYGGLLATETVGLLASLIHFDNILCLFHGYDLQVHWSMCIGGVCYFAFQWVCREEVIGCILRFQVLMARW